MSEIFPPIMCMKISNLSLFLAIMRIGDSSGTHQVNSMLGLISLCGVGDCVMCGRSRIDMS